MSEHTVKITGFVPVASPEVTGGHSFVLACTPIFRDGVLVEIGFPDFEYYAFPIPGGQIGDMAICSRPKDDFTNPNWPEVPPQSDWPI